PPYTINGLNLFLSRGLQALKDKQNKKIYLAYAHRPPTEMHEVQKAIITQGLAINQLLPGFNLYEGAEMHGNTTFLAILVTTNNISILYPRNFTDHIYTGEINPTTRIYQCKNGHEISVGSEEEIKTIEDLKASGCPICKNTESFIRIKTIKK
ncbi:MAG: bis-aminopropyl spermidine synthase family protein, partial [Candidatus Heimdallarchaeota archaeon]